jgi:hypothetical protein
MVIGFRRSALSSWVRRKRSLFASKARGATRMENRELVGE